MQTDLPIVIIGAGIIGISSAYELTERGHWCIILESRKGFAEGASSRNSEVVHGGFLSRKESLKQKLCVSGGDELKFRLDKWGIEWRNCGKIVVAVEQREIPRLEEIYEEARRIGAISEWFDESQVREVEPALTGPFSSAAWFSGSAVFDTHSYMQSLLSKIEDNGSSIVLESKVKGISIQDGFPIIHTDNEDFSAKAVINSAGIDADQLLLHSNMGELGSTNADDSPLGSMTQFQESWLGRWYRLHPRVISGMNSLVYRTSTPDQPGLGVHTTPDWSGNGVRLGPDSIQIDHLPDLFEERHKFHDSPGLRQHFLSRLGALYPNITVDDLIPDQVGIRSRAFDESGNSDFIFSELDEFPRTLNLLGMESPGVTASPAIASRVADWVSEIIW